MATEQIRVAVMSNAGGTGKTTLTVNVANELNLAGYSVCVFGLDPNASLGMFLGIPNPSEEEATLGSVLLDENFSGDWPLFDCWPERGSKVQACLSGTSLGDCIERLSTADRKTEVLADRLEDCPLPHDFLFFDCPGTVDLVHKVALSACDYILVPVQPDAKGVFAIATLLTWLYEQIRRLRLRPAPEILGVIPNRVQANAQHQNVLGLKGVQVQGEMPSLPDLLTARGISMFSPIKEYAEVSKSIMEGGLPLRAYRPTHPANQSFKQVATALIDRRL